MITTEGPQEIQTNIGDGFATTIQTNGNGGQIIKRNQQVNYISNLKGIQNYNVGFGSTMPTAAWVEWTAAEHDAAGISTAAFDPTKPDEKKTVQLNVESSNIYTVARYGETTQMVGMKQRVGRFHDLYESGDDRKARHKALREAGVTPPFPRADRFLENKHQSHVRAGVTTAGSY